MTVKSYILCLTLSIYLSHRFPRVCLANRRCSHGVSTSNADLPGTVYSLDEQCAMRFGAGYTFYDGVSITVEVGQGLVKQKDILSVTHYN